MKTNKQAIIDLMYGKKIYWIEIPYVMDLYGDPYERTQHDSEDYNHWLADRIFLLVPAQAKNTEFFNTI